MLALDNCIGLRVKITTVLDTVISGTIYSYNPDHELIVLTSVGESGTTKASASLKFVKSSFVKNIGFTNKKAAAKAIAGDKSPSLNDRFASFEIVPTPVSLSEVRTKLNKVEPAYRQKFLLDKALEAGPPVSKEGRVVFEKLFRLLPEGAVKWIKDDIVIFDDHLRIAKPYTEKDCMLFNGKDDANDSQLSYVRKVVAEQWKTFDSERKGG